MAVNAVGDVTRKVGDVYNYARPKVDNLTRKVKDMTSKGYNAAKVKALKLKQDHTDNVLIQTYLTGTRQEIDDAISDSRRIRDRYLSALKHDPTNAEVYTKTHDDEIARLKHLRKCTKLMFTKKSSSSSSSSMSKLPF
jgi:hypothetical protein